MQWEDTLSDFNVEGDSYGYLLFLVCFFKGYCGPLADAKIGILTHAFSYGTGFFEGIRAYYNEDHKQLYMFRLPEHYERFEQSARILHDLR